MTPRHLWVPLRMTRWLASPNVGNGNNVWNVTTSGTANNNNANNAYGVAPDCP